MRPFNPDHIPRPALDPSALAWLNERDAFDLEIGAGAGLHAVQTALANPTRPLVAIERTEVKFNGLARRYAQHGAPENLCPLRGDAVAFVTHFVRPAQLARVYLLYPNPYPKSRQSNLRWYNSPFMAHLREKMATDAHLRLATNLKWYADQARELLPAHFGFRLESERTLGSGDPPRTHFEKKYLARGETCFDLVFARD